MASDTSFTFSQKLHTNSYLVTKDNYIDQCRHIIQDMQEHYIPVIESFIWQPEYAVKNFDTLEYYKFISKNRFAVMKYDRKDYFKDYFLASDPYEEIINPIKLAVEKKKMSQ